MMAPDGAHPKPASAGTEIGGGEVERLGRRRERDDTLLPGAVDPLELPDRQRVEELVRNDQRRAGRHGLEAFVPSGVGVSKRGGLRRAQAFVRLHKVQIDGVAKGRHGPRGTQRIGKEGTAAGAELDEAHPLRLSHGLPHHHAPKSDQLAEHLAHLGRGDEVAARADGPAAAVITVLGKMEAKLHVGVNADGPVAANPLPYLVPPARSSPGLPAALAHRPEARGGMRRMRKSPITIIGSESTCPMLMPGRMKPRNASGSRNSSATIRATP